MFCRHEQRLHPNIDIPDDITEEETKDSRKSDHLYNYHCAKLKFGLILFAFNDAVKEGDGQRLHDIYKLALLLYKGGGHYKYAYVVLLHLVKLAALYSEFEAFQLLWNRFYNKYGLRGANISLDLLKEQMNKLLKTMWRALGPNLNQASAARVAEALENLELLLLSIDSDCGLDDHHGYRSKSNNREAVFQVMSDLMEITAFKYTQGRPGHPSFPDFPSSIVNVDYRDLHQWMTEKKKLWQSIYEGRN